VRGRYHTDATMSANVATHDLFDEASALRRVAAMAERATARYHGRADAAVSLLAVSENATFLVAGDGEAPAVLRVHRLGYHDRAEIASELAWLDALRAQPGVRTPRVIASATGERVVALTDADTGETRWAVMFEFVDGREPHAGEAGRFEALGALSARLHRHSKTWARPHGFRRFAWDFDAAFGPRARWGRWQDGVKVGVEERRVLAPLVVALRRRLLAFGQGPDRYGLIHADMRMSNLLVDADPEAMLIDFDDCGYGWHLYDLATAVSFFEDDPIVAELIDQWLVGYRSVTELSADDENEISTFILLRRVLLMAWIASHPNVDIARRLGGGYTAGTCALAEQYLTRFA
jgi:Ser/Thr protein kinase RdoA (MazF antagonist)